MRYGKCQTRKDEQYMSQKKGRTVYVTQERTNSICHRRKDESSFLPLILKIKIFPQLNPTPVSEFKEFEPRPKFETRLKYSWFHLKLYSMFKAGA